MNTCALSVAQAGPIFARAMGVVDASALEIVEPLLPCVWTVRRARAAGDRAFVEFTPFIADAGGIWPERGLALLRRYLDTFPPDALSTPPHPRGVYDLLRATAVPLHFEDVYPDASGPEPRSGVEHRPFRVILTRRDLVLAGPIEGPIVLPPDWPRPPRAPGPPGAPAPPGPPSPLPTGSSRAVLARDEGGGWAWTLEVSRSPASQWTRIAQQRF